MNILHSVIIAIFSLPMITSCFGKHVDSEVHVQPFGTELESEEGTESYDVDTEKMQIIYTYKFNESYFQKHHYVKKIHRFSPVFCSNTTPIAENKIPSYLTFTDSTGNEVVIQKNSYYEFDSNRTIYTSYANAGDDIWKYDPKNSFMIYIEGDTYWAYWPL